MNNTSEAGMYSNITGTTQVSALNRPARLLGFYVNSTTSGTLVLKDGDSSGTAVSGTITPAVGWHKFPAIFPNGIHATIANTLNVTLIFAPGP